MVSTIGQDQNINFFERLTLIQKSWDLSPEERLKGKDDIIKNLIKPIMASLEEYKMEYHKRSVKAAVVSFLSVTYTVCFRCLFDLTADQRLSINNLDIAGGVLFLKLMIGITQKRTLLLKAQNLMLCYQIILVDNTPLTQEMKEAFQNDLKGILDLMKK
jgi:hypothetical protein